MTDTLTIALAQLNPTVGDFEGNLERLREARAEAMQQGADLLLTSELYICGYPPEDLILKPMFVDSIRTAVDAFARETADGGPAVLLGTPWRGDDGRVYNAMVLIEDGTVARDPLQG